VKIYKFLQRIPIVGTLVSIANTYAFRGDRRSTGEFAGPWKWIKVLFLPLLFSIGLAVLTIAPALKHLFACGELRLSDLSDFSQKPGALAVSVIPNLLGFGIGVYALIFALASPIVRDINKAIEKSIAEGRRTHGSFLVINADLAYPLVVLVVTVAIATLQQTVISVALFSATWVLFWYSMLMILEVIGVLFGLGDQALLEKINPEPIAPVPTTAAPIPQLHPPTTTEQTKSK
jgi:hypothetical protein